MKSILTIILSFIFIVSGISQTRNVLVNTSSVIVQPTNFWSADASNARVGLGLGSSATNPETAFQPSSTVLSNLAANNASSLTNIQASNIVGVLSITSPSVNFTNILGTLGLSQGGTGATNAANARQNLGSTTVGDALFVATNAASARATIGATTVGSSLFTAFDEAAARSTLSLGSAATNPSSVFQPASTVLTNLANGNGSALSNIAVSNVIGALAITNGNGGLLTNLTATNITGAVAIFNGGTGATNAGGARTNLGLGTTNAVEFDSIILSTGDLTISGGVNDNVSIRNESDQFEILLGSSTLASFGGNAVFYIPIYFDNTTNAAATRTNIGIPWSGLTNSNSTNFRTALELATNSTVSFGSVFNTAIVNQITDTFNTGYDFDVVFSSNQIAWQTDDAGGTGGNYVEFPQNANNGEIVFYAPISFTTNTNAFFPQTNNPAGQTRTNLGLGWSALTNTNAGTQLVTVNSNGNVVSPTNFWQVAPIQTLVQTFTPNTNSTNYTTNSRNLYVYSSATNISGVTNVILLTTNSLVFDGDAVTVTHNGTTSSITAVRQDGSATNLTTISNNSESVKFIREAGQWAFYHNISYVEPIRFTDGNIEINKAISRTNLGLGWSVLTNTDTTNFHVAVFQTNSIPTNSANVNSIGFNTAIAWMEIHIATNGVTNSYRIPLFK